MTWNLYLDAFHLFQRSVNFLSGNLIGVTLIVSVPPPQQRKHCWSHQELVLPKLFRPALQYQGGFICREGDTILNVSPKFRIFVKIDLCQKFAFIFFHEKKLVAWQIFFKPKIFVPFWRPVEKSFKFLGRVTARVKQVSVNQELFLLQIKVKTKIKNFGSKYWI